MCVCRRAHTQAHCLLEVFITRNKILSQYEGIWKIPMGRDPLTHINTIVWTWKHQYKNLAWESRLTARWAQGLLGKAAGSRTEPCSRARAQRQPATPSLSGQATALPPVTSRRWGPTCRSRSRSTRSGPKGFGPWCAPFSGLGGLPWREKHQGNEIMALSVSSKAAGLHPGPPLAKAS